jgi:hypothetical protein
MSCDGYFFEQDEVESMETFLYDDDVYNLSVLGDESYVLQEIIAHNCLCFKIGVQMPSDEFIQKLRGWMTGEAAWPEMDQYATWLGVGQADVIAEPSIGTGLGAGTAPRVGTTPRAGTAQLLLPLGEAMVRWLWGDEGELDEALGVA